MSHIYNEQASGKSKRSVSEAVAEAVHTALGEHKPQGDHVYSITLVIEGVSFDGEEYAANVIVMIFDHTEAQLDLYHDVDRDRERRAKADEMAEAYLVAAHGGKHIYESHNDELAKQFEDRLKDAFDLNDDTQVSIASEPDDYETMRRENGVTPPEQMHAPRYHTDLAEPTLGPGGVGGRDGDDEGRAA